MSRPQLPGKVPAKLADEKFMACRAGKLSLAPQASGRSGKLPVRVRFVRVFRQPRACQVAVEQLEGSCVLMVYPRGLYACCQPSSLRVLCSQSAARGPEAGLRAGAVLVQL